MQTLSKIKALSCVHGLLFGHCLSWVARFGVFAWMACCLAVVSLVGWPGLVCLP